MPPYFLHRLSGKTAGGGGGAILQIHALFKDHHLSNMSEKNRLTVRGHSQTTRQLLSFQPDRYCKQTSGNGQGATMRDMQAGELPQRQGGCVQMPGVQQDAMWGMCGSPPSDQRHQMSQSDRHASGKINCMQSPPRRGR